VAFLIGKDAAMLGIMIFVNQAMNVGALLARYGASAHQRGPGEPRTGDCGPGELGPGESGACEPGPEERLRGPICG